MHQVLAEEYRDTYYIVDQERYPALMFLSLNRYTLSIANNDA